MIRKLRLKFIAITMGALLLLLAAVLVSANMYMNKHTERQIAKFLIDLAARDGELPEEKFFKAPPPKEHELIDGFSVKVDFKGNIIEIPDNRSSITAEEAEIYAREVLANGQYSGKLDNLRYMVQDKDYGKILVFADQRIQDGFLEELKRLSFIIGGISFVVLLSLVIVLSKLVTRPVESAFEKQKRFIANSGHELKTPLSILSANIDVLEMEIGQNKWLNQIKNQTERMSKLIHELLLLARTEEAGSQTVFAEFNLSRAILSVVLPFEVVAFEQGKKICGDIPENIIYKGDEQSIKKMVEALVDNAVKYSEENSTVSVKLYTKGTRRIIEVYNKGDGITEDQKDRLFEKFYRVDDSRARESGGYGLGLSIVKNIVDMHKGKIEIESKPGECILFRIILTN